MSLDQSRPHVQADFLVAASHALLVLEDVEAIPYLERLIERSTIVRQMVRVRVGHGTEDRLVSSFGGTEDEKDEMRRVRSASHVACERLRLLAEKAARGASLLRPTTAPEERNLLRPASSSYTDRDHLLRSHKPDDELQ